MTKSSGRHIEKQRLLLSPLPTVFMCSLTTPPNPRLPSATWLHRRILLHPLLWPLSSFAASGTPGPSCPQLSADSLHPPHPGSARLCCPCHLVTFSLLPTPRSSIASKCPLRRLSSPHLPPGPSLRSRGTCQSLPRLAQPTPGSPAAHVDLS